MSEFLISTTKKEREEVLVLIQDLGFITEKWDDGSFNFETHDDECTDELYTLSEEYDFKVAML